MIDLSSQVRGFSQRHTVYAGSNTMWSGQSRSVSTIHMYSSYDSDTKQNDIALLHLSSALNIADPNVKIARIPSVSSSTLPTGEWPPANIDVTLWLPFDVRIPPSSSNRLYNEYDTYMLPHRGVKVCWMICMTSHPWVIVDLTSYGIGCVSTFNTSVYTRSVLSE